MNLRCTDPASIEEIGGYPILDVFINFKVCNMRFYIRGEHINASFTNNLIILQRQMFRTEISNFNLA